MCECCNGIGHEFEARGMKCKIVIRNGNIMSVYLPTNATDIEVQFCPLCGKTIEGNNRGNHPTTE